MATITLTDVPDDLYARLAALAERNGRSVDQEAVRSLASFLERERPVLDGLLTRVPSPETGGLHADLAALHDRQRRDGVWLTDRAIEAAIEEGRA